MRPVRAVCYTARLAGRRPEKDVRLQPNALGPVLFSLPPKKYTLMQSLQSLPLRSRLLIGLTLFSMFFGAGNLIFPPFLGVQAGENTWTAMAGFLVTAVGFPILGVIAVAQSNGLEALAGRVSKGFAFIFTLLIYLSIGPCLAIPRTASTSFEMVVRPFVGEGASFLGMPALTALQALYSVIFFALAFGVALNPEKLSQRLGKFLCPTLIVLILVLFGALWLSPLGGYGAPAGAYASSPFAVGFIDGYQTMDTIAALNFGLVIAINIRALGVTAPKAVAGETVRAGLIAAVVFFLVYGALAHIGAQAGGAFSGMENGAQALTKVADARLGGIGTLVMGAIFFIACFNTCVGLISCCSNYFCQTFPVLSYRGWAAVFAVVSTVIANAGLTLILKLSIPVLVAIYPIAIALIVLGLIELFAPKLEQLRAVYPSVMVLTGIFSVLSGIEAAGFKVPGLSDLAASLPFAEAGLAWVLPAAAGFAIGAALSLVKGGKRA